MSGNEKIKPMPKKDEGLKSANARAWIINYADKCADTSPLVGQENTLVVPFITRKDFFKEYERFCTKTNEFEFKVFDYIN
jgi:hypothetical protein